MDDMAPAAQVVRLIQSAREGNDRGEVEHVRALLAAAATHAREVANAPAPERACEADLTHHVALVLDNDEPTYRARRAIVRAWIGQLAGDRIDAQGRGGGQAFRLPIRATASEVSTLADQLKDWAEELVGLEHAGEDARLSDGGHLLAREMLSTALAWVDWRQLATDWADEEQEVQAA